MRIAYFNEIDNLCYNLNADTLKVINGICSDQRIGNYYNNPSFGYGGYCLPKDSKELMYSFKDIPGVLIEAIVKSNQLRKKEICEEILNKKVNKIGIYRLTSKSDSLNIKDSSIIDIISILQENSLDLYIYEPFIKENTFKGIKVIKDLEIFKNECDLIIANRIDSEIMDINDKIFSKEISLIYLNFSDPWPKERHTKRRLTSNVFLEKYDKIFKNTKLIELKTDNINLFNF